MSKEATRRITKFDFSDESAHVALVDKAANEQEVLVMKSETPPLEDKPTIPTEEIEMTKKVEDAVVEDIQKSTLEIELNKKIRQAKEQAKVNFEKELNEAKEAHKVELEKAQVEIAKARKEVSIELEKAFVRKALNFTPFYSGDASEYDFAKSLLAVHGLGEKGSMVIKALEKAASLHIDTMDFEELGVTLKEEEDEVPMTGLQKALRANQK